MTESPETPTRSYGCSFGCGNPYDVIVVMVADGTTEFLCMPCFIKMASDMVEAITNPDSPMVQLALTEAGEIEAAAMNSPGPRKRGKNAPVTAEGDDILEAYEALVLEDELPDAYK